MRVLLLGLALALSFWIAPEWLEARVPALCLSRRLGFFCPGCGLTRGFLAMSHGQFRQALHFNVMAPGFYLAAWLCWIYLLVTGLVNAGRASSSASPSSAARSRGPFLRP